MTLGSWRYYDHELSVEDYFLSHGQEPGVWVGSGAAVVGLSGRVEEGQLPRLFDEDIGRDPSAVTSHLAEQLPAILAPLPRRPLVPAVRPRFDVEHRPGALIRSERVRVSRR
jgi:hypothetical protein